MSDKSNKQTTVFYFTKIVAFVIITAITIFVVGYKIKPVFDWIAKEQVAKNDYIFVELNDSFMYWYALTIVQTSNHDFGYEEEKIKQLAPRFATILRWQFDPDFIESEKLLQKKRMEVDQTFDLLHEYATDIIDRSRTIQNYFFPTWLIWFNGTPIYSLTEAYQEVVTWISTWKSLIDQFREQVSTWLPAIEFMEIKLDSEDKFQVLLAKFHRAADVSEWPAKWKTMCEQRSLADQHELLQYKIIFDKTMHEFVKLYDRMLFHSSE